MKARIMIPYNMWNNYYGHPLALIPSDKTKYCRKDQIPRNEEYLKSIEYMSLLIFAL